MGLFKSENPPNVWAWVFIEHHLKSDLTPLESIRLLPILATAVRRRSTIEELRGLPSEALKTIRDSDLQIGEDQLEKYLKVAVQPSVVEHLSEFAKLLLNKNPALFYLSKPGHVYGLLFNHQDLNEKFEATESQLLLKKVFEGCLDDIFGMNGYREAKVTQGLAMTFAKLMSYFALAGQIASDY